MATSKDAEIKIMNCEDPEDQHGGFSLEPKEDLGDKSSEEEEEQIDIT